MAQNSGGAGMPPMAGGQAVNPAAMSAPHIVRVPLPNCAPMNKPAAFPQPNYQPMMMQGNMQGNMNRAVPQAPAVHNMQTQQMQAMGNLMNMGMSMPVMNAPPAMPAVNGPPQPPLAPAADPNAGGKLPSRQYLEQLQIANEMEPPWSIPESLGSEEEVDKLLDSNYAIICELIRLRYGRSSAQPTPVERKLMELAESNLAALIGSQRPRAVVNARSAQSVRSMIRPSKEVAAPAQTSALPASTGIPLNSISGQSITGRFS